MADVNFITSNPATAAFGSGQQLADQQLARQQQQDQIQRQNTIQTATLPTQLRQMTAGADLAQTQASTAAATAPYAVPEAQGRLRQMNAGIQATQASTASSNAANRLKVFSLIDEGQIDQAQALNHSLGQPPIPPQIVQNGQMRAALAAIDKQALARNPDNPAAQEDYHQKKLAEVQQWAQANPGKQPPPEFLAAPPAGAQPAAGSTVKPVNVPYGGTLVDPHTGKPIYQNTGDVGPAPAPGAAPAQGEDFLKTLSPRDAQLAKGLATYDINPMSLSTKGGERERAIANAKTFDPSYDQTKYTAKAAGAGAGARTEATREKNLDLILRMTDAAIPAALEASDKVARYGGSFVPLNQIIQRGQIMTSDANLRAFGMANLQLAEGWARAMNPTGVMRESDRDKALSFLSTADSAATYKQLVMQLRTQIQRERDSISGPQPGGAPQAQPAPAAAQGQGGAPSAAPAGNGTWTDPATGKAYQIINGQLHE